MFNFKFQMENDNSIKQLGEADEMLKEIKYVAKINALVFFKLNDFDRKRNL